ETFNETQKRILKVASLDKQLTPKQRFDFFYQELLERTDKLAAAIPSIGTDYWGQVADKLQDLTTTLSDEEQEFYENYATLRKLGSLYAINEGGYSEESAGFWDSFMNRLLALFFPKTSVLSSSFGVKGTDKAVAINHAFERLQIKDVDLIVAINHAFERLQIKDVDLIRSEIVDEVKERMTPPWWGTEGSGGMLGTTTGIIAAMYGGGLAAGMALKATKGVMKILPILQKTPLLSRVKDLERIDRVFTRQLNKTRFGRYIASPVEMGMQFEITGRVFPTTNDFMSFREGFFSFLAAKGAMQVFSKVPTGEIMKKFFKVFGASSEKAAEIVKNIGLKTREAKALHYFGVGETIQESVQELVTIYRDELRDRGYWEEVYARFGEHPSHAVQLFVSSYVMGVAFGLGGTQHNATLQEMYESLSPEEKSQVDILVAELLTDEAIAEGAAETEVLKMINEKLAGEETTEEEQQQLPEGEIVRANNLEEAQKLWDEGYRADGVDTRAQLEGMFATGRPGIDMKKAAAEQEVSTEEQVDQEAVTEEVPSTEVAEEQDVEQEEETPIIS
ncbi:MAG: hypothetical protein ACXABD_22615, partial [Candidatus Thorarchaeota archaeon]